MTTRFKSTFKGFLAKIHNRFRKEYLVILYKDDKELGDTLMQEVSKKEAEQ